MDDKAIPTATYEPNNDLDKEDFGDKNAYIDDYVEYVKKGLVMMVDIYKQRILVDSWVLLNIEFDVINSNLVENAKVRSSTI